MPRPLMYVSDPNCEDAADYSDSLFSDPMTQHYGMGGEVFELWLKGHVDRCTLCREATMEASMP